MLGSIDSTGGIAMGLAKPVGVVNDSVDIAGERLCLHPCVGLTVDPTRMTDWEKVAAVAKVKCLEHDLFENAGLRRELSADEVVEMLAKINHLRRALGWLEVGLDERLQWPGVSSEPEQ
jgi:hypothetical protein